LGGQQAFPKPMRPVNTPLQPHLNIVDIPPHPKSDPANDGWETNQNKLVSRNEKWPSMLENHPQPKLVVVSITPSVNYFSWNQPIIDIKFSPSLKILIDEKAKKPMKESSSS
jgi:hypothetical protein